MSYLLPDRRYLNFVHQSFPDDAPIRFIPTDHHHVSSSAIVKEIVAIFNWIDSGWLLGSTQGAF
jgi:hypothetical protein